MTKRILALLLALCFVFAFAACKKDGGDNDTTTEAGTLANGETVANDETNSDAEAVSGDTTDVSGDATEAATDASGNSVVAPTQSGSSSNQGGTVAASKPSTKAEIVEYFNTAINDVKPHAKSITRKYLKHYVSGTITGVPSMVDKVLGGTDKFINDQMAKQALGTATFTSVADKNANFPVENESWASKLTAADVKSATCSESNGVYTIVIKTVDDPASTSGAHGTGHAPKAFSVVPASVISENIPGAVAKIFSIGTVTVAYPSSVVTVTVDVATGHVKTAKYTSYWTINIPLGDNNVVLPFATDSEYTVAY